MKYFCLGDTDTVLAFRLAGINGKVIDTSVQAEEILKTVFSMKNIGILLVTEEVSHFLKEKTDGLLWNDGLLIIEIPAVTEKTFEIEHISELIKKTIGVKL